MEIEKSLLKKLNKIGIGFISGVDENILFFCSEEIKENSIESISEGGFISFNKYSISIQNNDSYSIYTSFINNLNTLNYHFDLEYNNGQFNFSFSEYEDQEQDLKHEFSTVECSYTESGEHKSIFLDVFKNDNEFYISMIRLFESLFNEVLSNGYKNQNRKGMF